MRAFTNYDNISAAHAGGGGILPSGAYVVVIQNAVDHPDEPKPYLTITFDIAEGEHAGKWANESPDNEWRHSFRQYYNSDFGEQRLKAIFEAVEASNPGYRWNWQESTLVGKLCGFVIRHRLYTKKNGEDGTSLDLYDAVPVADVRAGNIVAPPDKDDRDPAAVAAKAAAAAPVPASYGQGGGSVYDEDAPF